MEIDKISNLIKTKRKEKGLTQVELANKLNVTEKAVSRWETGRGTPDISLLIPLAKELGVNISEILSGKVEKKTNDNLEEIIQYIDINKKTRSKVPVIISVFIYFIILITYLSYLRITYDVRGSFHFTYEGHLICNIFFSIMVLVSNKILSAYYDKTEDKKKIKKITYIIILIIYSVMILNLTTFGRDGAPTNYNLVPFKTITKYIFNYQEYSSNLILINLLGNLVVFIPVQYLIIKIFNINKFAKILLIDFIILFLVEIIQYITSSGVFDIDDIILSIIGMSFTYFIVNIINQKNIKK